jgi:hypothetical protein
MAFDGGGMTTSHTGMLSDSLALLRRIRDEFRDTKTISGRTQRDGEDLIQRLSMRDRLIGADEARSRLVADIRAELDAGARGYYLTPRDMRLLIEALSDDERRQPDV